jgi:hypothetical protein
MSSPTCFISYAWENEEHKEWVKTLATFLQHNGVETRLDVWDAYLGIDLTKYFEKSIRESDYVILVCTPIYAKKANNGTGGVGYEKMIVTGEIFQEVASPRKFIPLLRSGEIQSSVPTFLNSRNTIDFRAEKEFEQRIEELLRHIYQVPKHPKPALGTKPSFLEKPDVSSNAPRTTINNASFQEVFTFANSWGGINLSQTEATEFASVWMDQFNGKDFNIFKKVYSFANGWGGINLNAKDAKDFAINWVRDYYTVNFDEFKEQFFFALTNMNLNTRDAIKRALTEIKRKYN